MPIIHRLEALEILDSRGRPTLQATCTFSDGTLATAQVPSGASTGRAEASELRDGDPHRHAGFGCRKAVASVQGPIRDALAGNDWPDQASLDRALVSLDGTPNKARLGANAILAVSLAFARAHARLTGLPLYRHFADIAGKTPGRLPRLTVNLFSGGKHAGGQVAIQDVLAVPIQAPDVGAALADCCAVYQSATRLAARKYGTRALVADEGGLAPPFPDARTMIADAVDAIREAGFEPGRRMALAVDVASSHFFRADRYHLDGRSLDSAGMIDEISGWLERHPIVSIEDGLAEDDWDSWPLLRKRVAGRALVLGDDLLCSRTERIQRAARTGAANALLLKVNQIGSVTEALEALRAARDVGWHVTASARSGETEDDWLADLAVGWQADDLKVGSVHRSERLAKYNRLLAIERELGVANPAVLPRSS